MLATAQGFKLAEILAKHQNGHRVGKYMKKPDPKQQLKN